MPHFRVDDALHSHPKARQAGLEAMGLWNLCGSYCMGYLTDGFVPEWYVKSWPKGMLLAKRLVAARLWSPAVDAEGEKGWQFHEFTGPGRNDTREQVEESRKKWRDKKAGQRRDSPPASPGDTLWDTPGDSPDLSTQVSREIPRACASRAPSPTQPNIKSSSGHLRDDSHVSNAPEPPYDPDAEPRDTHHVVIDAPTVIDNPPKPQRRHPSSAAKTVVRQTLGTEGLAAYPKTFLDRLANQVDALYAEDHPDDLIRTALTEWDKRPDARPEWLHSVYGDIVKTTRATPGHNGRPAHKLRTIVQLAQETRAAENAQLEHATPKELA